MKFIDEGHTLREPYLFARGPDRANRERGPRNNVGNLHQSDPDHELEVERAKNEDRVP